MGIQDRDYFHDRHRHHAGVTDRRDYSQRLREMEEAGQTINIPIDETLKQDKQPAKYSVAILLFLVLLMLLGYLVSKISEFLF